MTRIRTGLALVGMLLTMTRSDIQGSPFALKDGDRVVLVGNTLIERDQSHGYLETRLTARFHDRQVTFRNLGWSGDTVFGEARAGFGRPEDGFRQLREHVLALKPTVLVLGYGGNESFDGEPGLSRFQAGLDRLLEALEPAGARLVVLAPIRHEDLGRPLPDPRRHNRDLGLFSEVLRKAAEVRSAPFVDLFHQLGASDRPACPLTDNGIHLTAYGYWRAAAVIERELGLDPRPWKVEVEASGQEPHTLGTKLTSLTTAPEWVRFELTDLALPPPAPPEDAPGAARSSDPARTLVVRELAPGTYALTVDGVPVARADERGWAAGVTLAKGPEFDQLEALRTTINLKNRLYFYRWRPQNETYLFGFRKHEQGQNAREVPLFDPLVAEQEAAIARLAVPTTHRYEIRREGEKLR